MFKLTDVISGVMSAIFQETLNKNLYGCYFDGFGINTEQFGKEEVFSRSLLLVVTRLQKVGLISGPVPYLKCFRSFGL
jgi:hypothetical protein